jgi:predicted lipoprotein with Yx(FWY)xxD motif
MMSVVVLLALAATACSGGGNGSSGSGGGSYGYGGGGNATPKATATSGSGSNSNALIKTAIATVKGASETILTDAQGKTLYYFTADTPTSSACTGACGQTWSPLLATGSGTPTSAATLPGSLTMQTTGNGNQVEYNGHLLYTFAGDTAPGQTNGEGIAGKWFVATSNLTSAGGSSPNSGSSSNPYGY